MSTDDIRIDFPDFSETDRLTEELRRIATEFHRQMQSAVIDTSGLENFIAAQQEVWTKITQAHAAQQELWAKLSVSTQIDWKGIHSNLEKSLERADHIGRLGWTFSMDMTLPDMANLSDMTCIKDADDYMNCWYDDNDPNLEKSEKCISEFHAFSSFSVALSQCFAAFRRKEYALTIPFLMTLVERAMLTLAIPKVVKKAKKNTNIAKIVKQRHDRAKQDFPNDNFMPSLLMSLNAFIFRLYEQSSKIDAADCRPFRHAVLHGNHAPPNNRIEVIRLVHAIQTIAYCAEVDVKKAANSSASALR